MNTKPDPYSPLARKELKRFFEPYRETFPDWSVEHDVILTRRQGPLRQSIDFQSLGYAAYQPLHSINLLLNIPDGCWFLQQHLDVKHRQVERLAHERMWSRVLRAMEEQFLPSIRKPLDLAETLSLAEIEVERDQVNNINYTTALAVLNAYQGNTRRAMHWCDRVEDAAIRMGRPLGGWEIRKRRYVMELQQAVKVGKEREFLSVA